MIATVNQSEVIAASAQYGERLRLLQVATENAYYNNTGPQNNASMSIAWQRANPNCVGGMSAIGYYFGLQTILACACALVHRITLSLF